jgi:hypothetical protein
MSQTSSIDQKTIQQWLAAKLDFKAAEKELYDKGLDAETVSTNLKEYKRLRNAKKQFAGFICMGLGAFLGFLSCVLSIINPLPELYSVFLFGLTSIAILVIVYGLYLVFE